MLSDAEFLSWCARNSISNKTREFIQNNIRHAQPVRSVGGGGKSLTGRYPSNKMGVTIQWESGKVEGPAVLMLENDDDVLEYFDQPNKIKLNYVNMNGKNRGVLYTPDFFVIRKASAGWEEWKNESDYTQIAKVQDWKYTKDENGGWICPPGEDFAKDLGLTFKVCSNELINWNLHRNYVFLDDFLRKTDQLDFKKEILEEVSRIIFQNPGVTLKQLIEEADYFNIRADDIYVLIIKGSVFVDLTAAPLAEPEKVGVFLHKEHFEMYSNVINCEGYTTYPSTISLKVGFKILWDGHIWTIINIGDSSISLISDNNYNEVPIDLFHKLINEGKIVSEQTDKLCESPIIDQITAANLEDYKVANYRLEHVKEYLKSGSEKYKSMEEPNLRKVRDWTAKFRKAEKLYGNGYVGLLPKDKNKGNRLERFDIRVLKLMDTYIENDYENMIQKNKSIVYGAFANSCEEQGYIPPSLATFCKRIEERPIEEKTEKRKGKRAKYQKEIFYWELEETTPRHGDFPFNIAHLDHTELDIELVCTRTGKNLGRPYLSLLIDAYSRKVLAFYISFEPPSYRSCMMVFRDCVRRFNRLPQQIVVDNGKEFHSVYFETLLAMYEREPKRRPPAKARYGSILERLFGTTNTNFIHNLQGNTKIMKNVREVTKSVNPKNHAVWSLPNLSMALEVYFFELYETIEHPALGETPRETFKSGLFYSGERKDFHIIYDSLFEILTLPSTSNGEATIQKNGIKINYIYYWNNEFKNLRFIKERVKVRFDPYNIGIAYAYVNKKWIKCISEFYPILSKLTQKELKFITAEIRKTKQNHSKNFTINAQRIAKFVNSLDNKGQYSVIKAKAEETKTVIHLIHQNSNILKEREETIINAPNELKEISKEKELDEELLELYGEL